MVEELGLAAGQETAPAARILRRSAPDWIAIRADYEAGDLTLNAICLKHGVSLSELNRHAVSTRWETSGRTAMLDRTILLRRLFGLFERQIMSMEHNGMTPEAERELTALNKLSATLDKLMDLENRAAPQKAAPQRDTREVAEIRKRLIDRIEQLKRAAE